MSTQITQELFKDLAPYDVVLVPDPVLKQKSTPVEQVNDAVKEQALRMMKTMYQARGIGLAANQVGITNRVIVVDVEQPREECCSNSECDNNNAIKTGQPLIMINPEITEFSKEKSSYQEGCLSIPAQYADVERPTSITLNYLDLDGNTQTMDADGLLSTAIQHEIDHIDGILFTDHLSRLKRSTLLRKLEKLKKDYGYDDNRIPMSA